MCSLSIGNQGVAADAFASPIRRRRRKVYSRLTQ